MGLWIQAAGWGGFGGDVVAEGFALSDVVALLGCGVDLAVVVVGAEVDEAGLGAERTCQIAASMGRPTATMAFFFPRRRAMRR